MLTTYQKEFLNQFSNTSFYNTSKKILISGHSGSGKSFVLKKLKADLKNKSENTNIKVTIFKNNSIFKYFKKKKFSDLVYQSLYTKELKSNLLTSFIKLVLGIFINEYALYKKLNKKYGDNQGKLVFFLMKYLLKNKRHHNILIFDNINFLVYENIDLLEIITNDRDIKSYYKDILNNTSFIISYTDNYYTSNELLNYLNKIEKNNTFQKFILKSIDINEIKEYMKLYGIQSILIDKYIHLIYKLSFSGNLALINTSCQYLLSNEIFSNINIKKELTKILETLLSNEQTTEDILITASLFDEPFLIEHLIMFVKTIHSYEDEDIENSIANAIKKFILKFNIQDDIYYVDFIDNFFSKYLKEKHLNENIKYYKSFSEFLKNIYPSQYYKRYKYNLLANNNKEAHTLYALYVIKQYRLGNFDISIDKSYKDKDILKDFKTAYQQFYLEDKSFTSDILHSVDIGSFDNRIQFEKDYLISLNELEVADQTSFNELYDKYKIYIEQNEFEKELIIRAQYILFMIEMYKKENLRFSNRLREFTTILNDSIEVDNTINYYKYSLYRRFRMQYEPEVARDFSSQSVTYFNEHKNKNILFKREYFFSLVNHADNQFQMDNLSDALQIANKAHKFMNENSRYLPKITLINNLVIFDLLENKIINMELLENCLGFLENIDLSYENRSTYIMLFSNISSIYAYIGNIEKSIIFSNNALKVLKNQNHSFSRYSYHIEINREIINYFITNKIPNLNKIFEQKKYNKDRYLNDDLFIKKQLNNYNIAFNDENSSFKNIWELDEYMQKKFANQLNRRWNVSARPLKFFTMQYWSK